VAPEVIMQNQNTDKDAFLTALRMWDRDDSELRNNRVLPKDTDIDSFVESFIERSLGNPSKLPM
jgi:hypothetical protein